MLTLKNRLLPLLTPLRVGSGKIQKFKYGIFIGNLWKSKSKSEDIDKT